MTIKQQYQISSILGPLYLVASDKGLEGINFEKQNVPMGENKILLQAAKELTEYFAGKRTKFEVPLDMQGTKFQVSVWKALLKIPYGKTCSYKDVARKIKNAKAVRAVGTANGRNPLCVIVPCHRVISADGTLGGYSGGLSKKVRLLELEC